MSEKHTVSYVCDQCGSRTDRCDPPWITVEGALNFFRPTEENGVKKTATYHAEAGAIASGKRVHLCGVYCTKLWLLDIHRNVFAQTEG